jgi:uncharacterized protein YjbI with pentapeptide repeats
MQRMKENQRKAALQAYIEKMSKLLLAQNLRDSSEDEEVRKIARVWTLTVLRRLDAERKGNVLRFLHESGLVDKDKRIIDLSGADLSGADLSGANLSGADLSLAHLFNADLSKADLSGVVLSGADMSLAHLFNADLSGADLSGADLRLADLSGTDLSLAHLFNADLSGADLSRASVTPEQLGTAYSLKDTIMPDGLKYP